MTVAVEDGAVWDVLTLGSDVVDARHLREGAFHRIYGVLWCSIAARFV